MRKYLLVVFLSLLCLACDSQKNKVHTFDEFKDAFNFDLLSIGTYFWDEFSDIEPQYALTENESKLLGSWLSANLLVETSNISYVFFPNKLFILYFDYNKFRIIDSEKKYFEKAVGTWEIINGVVRITIYAIITKDEKLEYPNNKGVFFVEHPYTIDFINIDDIDERGFTKRPINDTILSKELEREVVIKEKNKTNNLYVRNVYIILVITDSGKPEKDYSYFNIVPEMARENISGYEVATDAGLIKRFIFGLWP